MTTLKEDSDSWRANGLKVRDARHTHNGPEIPRYRKASRKNTCKNGMKHRFTKFIREYDWPWSGGGGTKVMACEVCGKQKWFEKKDVHSGT